MSTSGFRKDQATQEELEQAELERAELGEEEEFPVILSDYENFIRDNLEEVLRIDLLKNGWVTWSKTAPDAFVDALVNLLGVQARSWNSGSAPKNISETFFKLRREVLKEPQIQKMEKKTHKECLKQYKDFINTNWEMVGELERKKTEKGWLLLRKVAKDSKPDSYHFKDSPLWRKDTKNPKPDSYPLAKLLGATGSASVEAEFLAPKYNVEIFFEAIAEVRLEKVRQLIERSPDAIKKMLLVRQGLEGAFPKNLTGGIIKSLMHHEGVDDFITNLTRLAKGEGAECHESSLIVYFPQAIFDLVEKAQLDALTIEAVKQAREQIAAAEQQLAHEQHEEAVLANRRYVAIQRHHGISPYSAGPDDAAEVAMEKDLLEQYKDFVRDHLDYLLKHISIEPDGSLNLDYFFENWNAVYPCERALHKLLKAPYNSDLRRHIPDKSRPLEPLVDLLQQARKNPAAFRYTLYTSLDRVSAKNAEPASSRKPAERAPTALEKARAALHAKSGRSTAAMTTSLGGPAKPAAQPSQSSTKLPMVPVASSSSQPEEAAPKASQKKPSSIYFPPLQPRGGGGKKF